MNDYIRKERSGWRDQRISERHGLWGFNCPAADLDFLVAEFNFGKPVALIEYKLVGVPMPDLRHPTYRALNDLASNYNPNGLPFALVFYQPDLWWFRVHPVNAQAAKIWKPNEVLSELEFVTRLYQLRNHLVTTILSQRLNTKKDAA